MLCTAFTLIVPRTLFRESAHARTKAPPSTDRMPETASSKGAHTDACTQAWDVLHIAAGCWACGGGLSEAMASLALAQARRGDRVAVLYVADHPEHPLLARLREAGGEVLPIQRAYSWPGYFAPRLLRLLPTLLPRARRLHLHGCWSFPIWWAARCARRTSVPYALSAHGAFCAAACRRGAARKALFLRLVGRPLLARARELFAASSTEAEALANTLRALDITPAPPIRLLPNGIDTELFDSVSAQPRRQVFLYLGRLHPLKGLDLLLEAWTLARLESAWELWIVGPDDGARLPPLPRGVIQKPACALEAKARLIKSAAAVVLPSRSENFGLVVAEALYCHTPAICTTGAPWPELGDFQVAPTSEAIADALVRFAALSEPAREARFAPLFEAAAKRFSWTEILATFPQH